jgi:hypothetical protein
VTSRAMSPAQIVRRHRRDLALVLGNGINRYGAAPQFMSWDKLLLDLWRRHARQAITAIPEGITLTEFYDALELSRRGGPLAPKLQREFCRQLESWKPMAQHHAVVRWAMAHGCPILTTNFEETLAEAAQARLHRFEGERFTDYYPWSSYFAPAELPHPLAGFGIWHVNGMQRYYRSIRLGLGHYMGAVERARGLLYRGGSASLFAGAAPRAWRGADTWLGIVFDKPLLFIGFGLDPTEVFLRWLLIERRKYFRKYPKRWKPAWYAYAGEPVAGRELLLSAIGVESVRVKDYAQLYEEPWG